MATFFGYRSRAALLADKQYPLSNLHQASIIVLMPTTPIDERLKNLEDLPPNLPAPLILHQAIYTHLVLEKILTSTFWSYHDLERQALMLAHEYMDNAQLKNIHSSSTPNKVKIEMSDEGIYLIVTLREPVDPFDKYRGATHYNDIKITIWLQRVAAYIGYAKPEISYMAVPHTELNVGAIIHG